MAQKKVGWGSKKKFPEKKVALKKWGFEKNSCGKFVENSQESFEKCAERVCEKCGTKFVKSCEKVSHFLLGKVWGKFRHRFPKISHLFSMIIRKSHRKTYRKPIERA